MTPEQSAAILLNAGAVAIDAKHTLMGARCTVSLYSMLKLHQSLREAGFDIDGIRRKDGKGRL